MKGKNIKIAISIVAIILLLLILFLYYPESEKKYYLDTTFSGRGIDIVCTGVSEDYEIGNISMKFNIRKVEEGADELFVSITEEGTTFFPKDDSQCPYISLSSGGKSFDINRDPYGRYYFDLSKLEKEFEASIYIDIYKLPEKEKIMLLRSIFVKIKENAPLKIQFPSNVHVTHIHESGCFAKLYYVNNIINAEFGKDISAISLNIYLERSGECKALKYAKLGIFLAAFLSGLSLIISVYYGEKK